MIVGLGNPGRAYRNNSHNIGFKVASRLAARHEISMSRLEMKAIVGKGRIADHAVIVAKPLTFMNKSGNAVGSLVNYYDVPLARLMVVYDEIDLPLGTLRLREKGGSGGHNGMKSIIEKLGGGFPRLRLGVGRPPGKMEAAAHVLRDFNADEEPIVDDMMEVAVAAIETYLSDGIELAMTRHNRSLEDS
ncbi:MAG: aminoacyl-tRNA hydrolase [Chloroflexota bacterium]|nr:MAG: aminoacyl-tRNA hydrolase [Chloroflexota bacterium]